MSTSNPLARLAYLWRTPSAFLDDWRKYARNQAGHGAVGIVAGLLTAEIGMAFGVACVVFYTAWELTQWQFRRAAASDCAEDWAFAFTGFAIGLTQAWLFLVTMAVYLIAGIFWRIELKNGGQV